MTRNNQQRLWTLDSTSSGCDILRARNSSADFGASDAFPNSLTGQETHVRSLPLSSLSYFDTHPIRRSDVGTDPFRPNPVVYEVSPVPLTDAEGRLCTSCVTPYRAPVMGEADVRFGNVEHNPELGSHIILSPTLQPIERWQETHAYSSIRPKDCQGNSTPSLAISGSKPLPLGTVGNVKIVSEDHRSYFDECTLLDVHAHSAMHRSLPDNKPQNSRNESAVPISSPGKDTHARPLFPPSPSNIDTDWSRNLYILRINYTTFLQHNLDQSLMPVWRQPLLYLSTSRMGQDMQVLFQILSSPSGTKPWE